MIVVNKLVELYSHSTPIESITCDTKDYKIFKYDKAIRFCDSHSLIKYTPVGNDDRIDAFCGFIHDNPYFWFIPLRSSKGTIFGFVLKSYHQKAYRNIFCEGNIISSYGFHNFQKYKKGFPIILCEGTKDAIALSQIYPFTLANLTVGLNAIDGIKMIKNLTNKVALAYDEDKRGQESSVRDIGALSKEGVKAIKIHYSKKDPGECLLNQIDLHLLKQSVASTLHLL